MMKDKKTDRANVGREPRMMAGVEEMAKRGMQCAAVLGLTALTALSGCASKEQAADDAPAVSEQEAAADGQEEGTGVTDMTVIAETVPLEELQWSVIQEGTNACFSPAGLKYAMLMLQAGADDGTAAMIGSFLGEEDLDAAISSASALKRSLYETGAVSIECAVGMDEALDVKGSYASVLEEELGASLLLASFSDGSMQKAVNSWATEATGGLLNNFPVDEDEQLSLLSAVAFSDGWDLFDEADTTIGTFLEPYGEISAYMMHGSLDGHDVMTGSSYTAVAITMGSSTLTAYLPNDGMTVGEVAAELAGGEQPSADGYGTVYVTLPRASYMVLTDLTDMLADAGLSSLFTGGGTMFSAMTDDTVCLTSAQQKTSFSMSEAGVETAAATGLGISLTSLDEDGADSAYNFEADRPFMYTVECQGEILFLGCISYVDEATSAMSSTTSYAEDVTIAIDASESTVSSGAEDETNVAIEETSDATISTSSEATAEAASMDEYTVTIIEE